MTAFNDNSSRTGPRRHRQKRAFHDPTEIFARRHRASISRSLAVIEHRCRWTPPTPTAEQADRIDRLVADPAFRRDPDIATVLSSTDPATAEAFVRLAARAAVAIENGHHLPLELRVFTRNVLVDAGAHFCEALAAGSLDLARVALDRSAAHAIRQCRIWSKGMQPDCDPVAPDTLAICDGPDAMRDYLAKGGRFCAEPDAFGTTNAHTAARACHGNPDTLATFIHLGGPFHDKLDHAGTTPSLDLLYAGRPDAVHAFTAAGGRLTLTPDRYGQTVLSIATDHGPEMLAAVRQALEAQQP